MAASRVSVLATRHSDEAVHEHHTIRTGCAGVVCVGFRWSETTWCCQAPRLRCLLKHPEETVIYSRYDQIFIPASSRRNSAAWMHLENVLRARDVSNIWTLNWKRRYSNNAGESSGGPVWWGQEKSITARPLCAAFPRRLQSSSTDLQRYRKVCPRKTT